ncbi:ABC1 kinase family protein [Candidatus Synechococcus calcipolaris]|uniref:ABC1 kinase family protein n=1 Tax=Candidatus Synechococcus calcipolaris TaxID=1522304 RepID=UPI003BAD52AF
MISTSTVPAPPPQENAPPTPRVPPRRYDADAIAAYYNFRPWLILGRMLRIATLFLVFWLRLQWDHWAQRTEQNIGLRAMQLRQLLISLGPTFIKIGQALSTRPDLIRRNYLEELTLLQDKLPPFDNDLAIAIIERELNQNLGDIYAEFSPQPVAAASLGQVYRARLHSGEDVAVKVQRPHLLPVITRDLYLIRLLITWVGPWLPLNLGHDLRDVIDEFGRKLFEEIDYLNEGRNAEKFAANFREDPTVKVPAIYWPYTSERVLTLEWIQGIKLTRTECMVAAGVDPDQLIRVGVISGLRQLLEFGFFHADPHPGNLFAMADGRMAYIDFGMMDQLEEDTKESLVDAVVHLVNKDYIHLAQDFIHLGFLSPDTDIMPIVPALECVLDEVLDSSVQEFNFKTVTDRFSELMYEYPFRVPAKFALIIRSLVTQEGIALCLNPDFRIVDVSYPYIARRLLQGESAQLRRRLLDVLFKEDRLQWQRLENLIAIARTDQHFNLAPTATLGLQYLFSEEGQFLRRQIVLALTEDDRLHTEEVQRLWNLIKSDLRPLFFIDVAWGALKASVSQTLAKDEEVVAIAR